MKIKKILAACLAVAMLMSVLTVSATAAEDPEITPYSSSDLPYTFNFKFLTATHLDDTNPKHMGWKDNDSSVYLKSEVFPGNYYVYTNAYVNGQVKDCTQRDALVKGPGEWLIYNLIYETYGRVQACLGGVRAQGGPASGQWSPDYQYYPGDNIPHLNP